MTCCKYRQPSLPAVLLYTVIYAQIVIQCKGTGTCVQPTSCIPSYNLQTYTVADTPPDCNGCPYGPKGRYIYKREVCPCDCDSTCCSPYDVSLKPVYNYCYPYSTCCSSYDSSVKPVYNYCYPYSTSCSSSCDSSVKPVYNYCYPYTTGSSSCDVSLKPVYYCYPYYNYLYYNYPCCNGIYPSTSCSCNNYCPCPSCTPPCCDLPDCDYDDCYDDCCLYDCPDEPYCCIEEPVNPCLPKKARFKVIEAIEYPCCVKTKSECKICGGPCEEAQDVDIIEQKDLKCYLKANNLLGSSCEVIPCCVINKKPNCKYYCIRFCKKCKPKLKPKKLKAPKKKIEKKLKKLKKKCKKKAKNDCQLNIII